MGGGRYRFGFNGKENDNEVKGDGNQQGYGMRIYDPRVGRFLSVDPITKNYPMLTPYQFASNRPIDGVDMDGLEYKNKSYYSTFVTTGTAFKMIDNKMVASEIFVMKVGANPDNMPSYFKRNNLKPDPAFVEGHDPVINGIGFKSSAPSYSFTSGIGQAVMADGAVEPTMHLSQERHLAPEAVPTNFTKGMYGITELLKNVGVGIELFSPENRAKSEAMEDKRTFYNSINLVNNFFSERLPGYNNIFIKSQLINYINDGTLPYSWEDINKLRSSSNELDRMKANHHESYNDMISSTGKQIFDARNGKNERPKK